MYQNKLDNIKAVIFDLDGTLLNTLSDITDSLNVILSKFGFNFFNEDDVKTIIGGGIEQLIRSAFSLDCSNEQLIKAAVTDLKNEYLKHWDNKSSIYDGIPQLLDYFTSKKIKMGVLSNKPHDLTVKAIDKYFSKWSFSTVKGDNAKNPIKPDPFLADLIAKEFELFSDEIIMLGDTKIDIHTAKNAGFLSVGVLWGFRDEQELINAGADIIISSPYDLISLFSDN